MEKCQFLNASEERNMPRLRSSGERPETNMAELAKVVMVPLCKIGEIPAF
jgi:hypothetical protein